MIEINFRQAAEADLPVLISMLADDQLGKTREDSSIPLNPAYGNMFNIIDSDPNNELIVATTATEEVIGMLQITYIPYLTHTGSWRGLIEGVRVHKEYRGRGIGTEMFRWAIEHVRKHPCAMVQLTSNKQRREALHFYQNLGFVASHEGFKLVF